MKQLIFVFFLVAAFLPESSFGQSKTLVNDSSATQKKYRALYALNSGEEKKINGILRNIKNSMNDPRLKGKLDVELVVFGDGVALFQKSGPYKAKLQELQKAGVMLAQCENTLRERKIDKATLFDFISFVPSGVGEIIIRQHEGWTVIHP